MPCTKSQLLPSSPLCVSLHSHRRVSGVKERPRVLWRVGTSLCEEALCSHSELFRELFEVLRWEGGRVSSVQPAAEGGPLEREAGQCGGLCLGFGGFP